MTENNYKSEALSFMEYYAEKIRPTLKELDIAIKSKQRLKNKDISRILGISEKEIIEIRQKHNIKSMNHRGIIKIMELGTSEICAMFQREVREGSPFTYTKEQLAFIYGLDLNQVISACNKLNISEITWQNMPLVFEAIPYAANNNIDNV